MTATFETFATWLGSDRRRPEPKAHDLADYDLEVDESCLHADLLALFANRRRAFVALGANDSEADHGRALLFGTGAVAAEADVYLLHEGAHLALIRNTTLPRSAYNPA